MNNQEMLKSGQTTFVMKDVNIPLPTAAAQAFLVDTINNAGTLKKLQPHYTSAPAGNIDVLTAGTRKLRLAGKTDTPAGVNGISPRQIPYAVKKVKWDEWIQNDDVFYAMQNRGQDAEAVVVEMIQKQFGVDLQDLIFNGDTASGDPFLNIIDGFVKKAKTSTNKTDLTTNEPTILDFVNHIQLLPEKYKSRDDINWFITQKTNDKLVALVANRATGFGDAVLQDGKITRLAGYSVEVVATMQTDFACLTPMENLKPVFTRDVRYNRTAVGATAAAKDATYHILFAYLDAIVREVEAVAWMTGTKL
jgi:HK97 family phage major capsid protein